MLETGDALDNEEATGIREEHPSNGHCRFAPPRPAIPACGSARVCVSMDTRSVCKLQHSPCGTDPGLRSVSSVAWGSSRRAVGEQRGLALACGAGRRVGIGRQHPGVGCRLSPPWSSVPCAPPHESTRAWLVMSCRSSVAWTSDARLGGSHALPPIAVAVVRRQPQPPPLHFHSTRRCG